MNFLPPHKSEQPDDPNQTFGDVVRGMSRSKKAGSRQNPALSQQEEEALLEQPSTTGHRPKPADTRVPLLPVISQHALRFAAWQARRTLAKQFSAIRISRRGRAPELPDTPVLLYCNHPSIWTPLLGTFLATQCWPSWRHYAPADPAKLARYSLALKTGFFAVPENYQGPSVLLRMAYNVLQCPGHMLWLPATTKPSDPRMRPLPVHKAIVHLARRLDDITILPLAIEHTFRDHPLPEALVRFGQPIHAQDAGRRSFEGWKVLLQRRLNIVIDRLAEESRDPKAGEFHTMLPE